MRRICPRLAVFRDTVADHRKTFAFLKAIPDKHFQSFKTGLLCSHSPAGSAGRVLAFKDVANRATNFHALHICGTVLSSDDG